jgi:hypothetical protein
MDCDKAIHRYFRDHWRHLFPGLGDRTTSLRQAANLWCVKQQIREDLLKRLLPFGSQLRIAGGFPMPVRGFRRAYFSSVFKLKEEFKAVDILPHTPLRSNRKDDRPAAVVKRLNNRRRLLETVFGQLAERFKIEKVRARDLRHLTVRVGRKLPAHTINCFRHQAAGNPILRFERIFS